MRKRAQPFKGTRMKNLLVILAAVAVLGASCGNRGSDDSGAAGGTSTTVVASSAGPGDWGALEDVCGPKEGGGKVPAADARGVSASAIKLSTVADPGFSGRPGLNQEVFDAGDAFVTWCNAAGGVNGKKLELTKRDAKLTDYKQMVEASCQTDFALVGGGAVADDSWPDVGPKCGLIDVAGFAATPAKAGLAGDTPAKTRTVQAVPNPADRFAVGAALQLDRKYPDAKDRHGYLYADLPTAIEQKAKEQAAFEQLDHLTVYESAYHPAGESDWKPFASAIKRARVTFLTFVGEPANGAALAQALDQIGYTPTVRLLDANFYDQSYIDAAGMAAEGAYVGTVFAPLEEADHHPATQLYEDNITAIKGKKAVLGLQSTSAWLLFATVAKGCDLNNNLTRTCLLDELAKVTTWTGGGLHAPSSPGTNEGPDCVAILEVKDGVFTRWGPTDQEFACSPKYVATVKPAS